MIKYGMSLDYLPDWGIQEALREIYQNFQDFGEFDKNIIKKGAYKELVLKNGFKPDSLEFLKIGCSGKRNNSNTVGEHGEGLKMAMMVLLREECPIEIKTPKFTLTPTTYDDPDLGECFAINKDLEQSWMDIPFTVSCTVPGNELFKYEEKQLKKEDILHSCYYGQLLKDKPGQVFVGGIYVCTEQDLKYGYNFKPEYVSLDRDRKVPKAWDVNWYAARILESYKQITEDDLTRRDCQEIHTIPTSLQKKFEPTLTKSGDVIFQTKKGTVANRDLSKNLLARPDNQKKVQKLRYSLTKKRVPHTILQEFLDNYITLMNQDMKIDFAVLIDKAKQWKIDK